MARAKTPIRRTCPLCGAKPGQLCRTPSEASTWMGKLHAARESGRLLHSRDWINYLAHVQVGHVR